MTTKTIRTQAQLIEAAKAAGLTVTENVGHVVIVRCEGRSVAVWDDRTNYDGNTPMWAPRRLTVKAAADLLQLA